MAIRHITGSFLGYLKAAGGKKKNTNKTTHHIWCQSLLSAQLKLFKIPKATQMLLAKISHFLMDIYSLKQSLITFAICI